MRWPALARPDLLRHPLLAGSVALLAVNDHVLKGWSGVVAGDLGVAARAVTGKASDVAGVVVVALLLGVVAGGRSAYGRCQAPTVRITVLAATAVGFAALKVAPGVAEVAAPVLGGVTRRDATDLLALVVLVPVAGLLRRSDPAGAPQPATAGRPGRADEPGLAARCAGAVAAALPVAVAGTSILTISATACDIPPAVTSVTVVDGVFRAETPGLSTAGAVSRDGLTWEKGEPVASTTTTPPTSTTAPADHSPVVCAADGTCYRTERDEAVQSRTADGTWRDEVRFTPAQVETLDDEDPCSPQGRFDDVAVLDDVVVVPLGKEGVLRKDASGEWGRVGVLGIDPSPLPGWEGPTTPEPPSFGVDGGARWAPILAGVAALVLAALSLWRRGPLRGLAVALAGGGIALGALAIVAFVAVVRPMFALEPVVVVASVGSFVVSLVLTVWPRAAKAVPLPRRAGPAAVRPPEDPSGQRSPW